MRSSLSLISILSIFMTLGCISRDENVLHSDDNTPPKNEDSSDPFLWLEDVDAPRALDWVKAQSAAAIKTFTSDNRYEGIESAVRKIVLASDRIPSGSIRNGFYYNFWQDKDHVKGLWRRMSLDDFRKKSEHWEIILDVDALAAHEKENWVLAGTNCYAPANKRCLISLSRGGGDAKVVREFDIETKSFVKGGFELPEAKSSVAWVDENTIFVGTNWGPGSMTESGYPRRVKLWTRGQAHTDAVLIYEGQNSDVAVSAGAFEHDGQKINIVERSVSFFQSEYFLYKNCPPGDKSCHALTQIPIPGDASLAGLFQNRFIINLRSDWARDNTVYKSDSVLSLDAQDWNAPAEVIYTPDARSSVSAIDIAHDVLYVVISENVKNRILAYTHHKGWSHTEIKVPSAGSTGVNASAFESDVLVSFESFLQPPTLYLLSHSASGHGASLEVLRQLPPRFAAEKFEVHQIETPSSDGTKIPYYIIHKKGIKLDGSHPTLLYGYGGFEISLLPSYLSTWGKVWLEAGGVYVLANIRGGGEFGPKWHKAGLKEHRQIVYDDFISVAQDLITRNYTAPKHLGIMGGSNGGLLVGAVSMQRPDLFGAVVCAVPLLDMLRYDKLLAGHSWMEEYGDPADPNMRAAILKYSPYQNLKKDKSYPEIFFTTSTRDDRVHPGHARKMAAKMQSYGHPFFYYENMEGGHAGAANLEQKIKMSSFQFVYLMQKLF